MENVSIWWRHHVHVTSCYNRPWHKISRHCVHMQYWNRTSDMIKIIIMMIMMMMMMMMIIMISLLLSSLILLSLSLSLWRTTGKMIDRCLPLSLRYDVVNQPDKIICVGADKNDTRNEIMGWNVMHHVSRFHPISCPFINMDLMW